MVAVLPCSISKPIRRRILVSKDLLESLFGHAVELHQSSAGLATGVDKKFIENHLPVIAISYKDGTDYKIRDLETLRDVVPGRGKSIASIEISSRVGDYTCSMELNTSSYRESARIRAAGLEDKIGHFVEIVVAELLRDSDITVFARRVWSGAWAFLFSALLWLILGWHAVRDAKSAYGLGMVILITALLLSIPIEMFRSRWLPPVAFLWGSDGTRAKQARTVVTVVMATIPLGMLINALSAIFLR